LAIDIDGPRVSLNRPPFRPSLLGEASEPTEFSRCEGRDVRVGIRFAHLLRCLGELLPRRRHLDAELVESCLVVCEGLRTGILRHPVTDPVEGRLAPDARGELRL